MKHIGLDLLSVQSSFSVYIYIYQDLRDFYWPWIWQRVRYCELWWTICQKLDKWQLSLHLTLCKVYCCFFKSLKCFYITGNGNLSTTGGSAKGNVNSEERGPSVSRVSRSGGGSGSTGHKRNLRPTKRKEGQNYFSKLF